MNRVLLFLITLTALCLFGSAAAQAGDCPVYQDGAATGANGNCGADLNGDGRLDEADDAIMLAAMQSGDLSADLNGNGTVNGTDFNLFVNMKSNP